MQRSYKVEATLDDGARDVACRVDRTPPIWFRYVRTVCEVEDLQPWYRRPYWFLRRWAPRWTGLPWILSRWLRGCTWTVTVTFEPTKSECLLVGGPLDGRHMELLDYADRVRLPISSALLRSLWLRPLDELPLEPPNPSLFAPVHYQRDPARRTVFRFRGAIP